MLERFPIYCFKQEANASLKCFLLVRACAAANSKIFVKFNQVTNYHKLIDKGFLKKIQNEDDLCTMRNIIITSFNKEVCAVQRLNKLSFSFLTQEKSLFTFPSFDEKIEH